MLLQILSVIYKSIHITSTKSARNSHTRIFMTHVTDVIDVRKLVYEVKHNKTGLFFTLN